MLHQSKKKIIFHISTYGLIIPHEITHDKFIKPTLTTTALLH